jgi:putative membrane protein
MAVFAVIGVISIAPTRAFIAWVKRAGQDASFALPEADAKRIRRLVMIELHLMALVPLFAALMARGIGS